MNFIDLEGINRLILESQKSVDLVSKSIEKLSNSNLQIILERMSESQVFFNKFLRDGEFSKILESTTRNLPYNYSDLRISSQISLIEVSYNVVFGTFDSIPKEVIYKILESDFTEDIVNDILLSNTKIIMNFVQTSIEAVHENERQESNYLVMLLKSCTAFNEGHFEASQSLSTVIWDSYLTNYFSLNRRANKLITEIRRDSPEFDINKAKDFETLYARAAYGPIIASYTEPNFSTRYSRNGTVHNAGSRTLNELNALKALTIATGILQYAWRKGDLYSIETQ